MNTKIMPSGRKLNCKVKRTIEVDSDAYNENEEYSKAIDNQLLSLFKAIAP